MNIKSENALSFSPWVYSVWPQVNLSLKIEGLPVIDGGGSWLVWVSSEGEGRRSCLPPASKRPKTQGLQLLERVLGEAGAEKVAKPLRQLLVSHGDQACLVSRAPLPSSLEQWRQASGEGEPISLPLLDPTH